MTHLTYFFENSRPYRGIGSRVLHQTLAFHRAQGRVVYWLAAMATFGPARAPGLRHEAPAKGLVTYRLRLTDTVVSQAPAAVPTPARTLALVQQPLTAGRGRNYLLDHQQAAYEELEASQPVRSLMPLSLAEITRDLAGWTTPQGSAPSTPATTAKQEKKAAVKRRHA